MIYANADQDETIDYYIREHDALNIPDEQFNALVSKMLDLYASLRFNKREFSIGDTVYAPLFDFGGRVVLDNPSIIVSGILEGTDGHEYIVTGQYLYSPAVHSERCFEALVKIKHERNRIHCI